MTHPGVPVRSHDTTAGCGTGPDDFACSSDRLQEVSTLTGEDLTVADAVLSHINFAQTHFFWISALGVCALVTVFLILTMRTCENATNRHKLCRVVVDHTRANVVQATAAPNSNYDMIF
jgi:hypothetical protein